MTIQFQQESVSDGIKAFTQEVFKEHAIGETGMDGLLELPVAFVAYDGAQPVSVVTALHFWGQLHVKQVATEPAYRGRGLAAQLMEQAHDYGRNMGCDFAMVETMSFQAEEFYKKLGYQKEFARDGYAAGTSFIYLKKNLKGS